MNIKKLILFSAIMGASVHCSENKTIFDRLQSFKKKYGNDLMQGFCSGIASSTAINFLRSSILPNLDNLKLHDRTGICRDQLAGQCKVATALAVSSLVAPDNNSRKHTLVRIAGVLLGINTGTFASHYIAGKLK